MRVCAIQQPYPYTPEEAPAAVEWLIGELDSCDASLDLIVTPEYSNAPTAFPPGESRKFARAHFGKLNDAAVAAAKRCHAIVAMGCCAELEGNICRNTTRVFAPDGSVAGDYYKQQLVLSEPASRGVDDRYTLEYRPPTIVEVCGIRFGFVTCYDAYFDEYIAHLARRHPDVVLVCSHQRGERHDILEMLNRSLAFHTNAFVVRASVGMGEEKQQGGSSMVVDPSGKVLANSFSRNGKVICDIPDIHWKYMRSDSFGGALIPNDRYIEKGRTPWSYRPAGSAVRQDDRRMPFPRVCAWRGFGGAPANSLPAFGEAAALGADEIAFETVPSADGVPVIMHETRLDKVSDGHGMLCDMTFAELKKLDFGSRTAPGYAGLTVASPADVLKKFPRQIICELILDDRLAERYSPEFFRAIADAADRFDCLGHLCLCAGETLLGKAAEIIPEIPRCLIAGKLPHPAETALGYRCAKILFDPENVSREAMEEAHAAGLRCLLRGIDDPEAAARAVADGADVIITRNCWQVARRLGR